MGSIRGTKWRDNNGNGVRDVGEAGWAGVRVYLDTNGNGVWDSAAGGEPFAFTAADDPLTVGVDETGAYSLNNLPMGNYVVREQVPAGATQTTTGLQPVYLTTFDGPAVPALWESAGSLAISQLADRSFLGVFANQSVQLSLTGIPTHNLLHVEFDLVVLGGWNGAGGAASGDEDAWQFQVAASAGSPQYQFTSNFANTSTPGDPLLLQSYPNPFGGALQPAYTGASEIRTLGSMLPGAELRDAIYHLSFDVPHSGTTSSMSFLGDLELDPQVGKAWGIDNVQVSVPSAAHYIALGPGANVANFDFGNYVPMATIHGEKWSDADGDGVRDAGEPGMNGVTIYADLDNDGQYDADIEPANITARLPVTPGDYNLDDKVDAADYVVWRKSVATNILRAPTAMVTASSTKATSSYGGSTSARPPRRWVL